MAKKNACVGYICARASSFYLNRGADAVIYRFV
jgi:hypothetical protein